MCGANGVDAQRPERFKSALPRAQRDSRAESAGIVMKTDALELEVAPVEPEARRGLEMRLAYTEGRRLVVKRCAACADACHSRVKIRLLQIPQLRRLNIEVLLKIRSPARRDCLWFRLRRLHYASVRADECELHSDAARRVRLVDHGALYMHGGLLAGDLRRRDERAPVLQVNGVGGDQSHVTIDARARVPARGWLAGVVRAHG